MGDGAMLNCGSNITLQHDNMFTCGRRASAGADS